MKIQVFPILKKWLNRVLISLGTVFLLFLVLSVASITALVSGHQKKLPDDMILRLVVEGDFSEVDKTTPLDILSGHRGGTTLFDVTRAIKNAASDDRVKGLVISVKSGQYGYAHINELHQAMDIFKQSKKPIYAYGSEFDGTSAMAPYYIAMPADEIWMQPLGTLGVTGFYLQTTFFKKLLDTVGIKPDILHEGDYKSAPEAYMRDSMSPQNREMSESLLNDYYDQFISDVAKYRPLDKQKINDAVDNAPLMLSEAIEYGLVDKKGYKDQFIDYVEDMTESKNWVDVSDYYNPKKHQKVLDKYIAILPIDGVISSQSSQGAVLGEDTIALSELIQDLETIKQDDDCAGVVIRINSPGGTPDAAEELRRTIVQVNAEKPVIVSMGNVAASGGYWIAVNAREIVAQPMTLTGSIGVFGGKVTIGELLKKVGVNIDGVKIGNNADIWSMERPYTDKQRVKMEKHMRQVYDAFVERVAFGRGMTLTDVQEKAKGRVYTGNQALKSGLVDMLGGVDDAIERVKYYARVNEAEVVYISKNKNPLEALLGIVQGAGVRIGQLVTIFNKITMDYDNNAMVLTEEIVR